MVKALLCTIKAVSTRANGAKTSVKAVDSSYLQMAALIKASMKVERLTVKVFIRGIMAKLMRGSFGVDRKKGKGYGKE